MEQFEVQETDTPHLHVVGVGASAGGLEALELLFRDMPPDSGMAFIVQQHLSPDFESRMEELLARETALRVRTAQHGMVVEPNTVYVAPPRKEMILSGGKLLLTDRDREQGFSLPIDHFFRSLAADAGPHAIAIVLSGTGSDGSRGIRDVHASGGLVIVQSPESARFDGMPKSATATGVADLVLDPTAMPQALVAYARRNATGAPATATAPTREVGIAEILRLIRAEYGIDFTHYKPNTVMRRVERRLQMAASLDIDEYAEYLRAHRDELSALYHDLLIGVTRFFRDPEAFTALDTQVLPELLANAGDEEVRIWVPGCATGEEAYSIAMLLVERTQGQRPPIKIFATDIHRASLEIANLGRYPIEAISEVDAQRRERFFRPDGDHHVRIDKELRQLVVFATHNVISDAPFTRLNLISCRNMLIYLQPPAQRKVLSLFHFGLRTGGVLFLGPSETPGPLDDEFDPIHKHWRLYKKRRDVRLAAGDARVPIVSSQLLSSRRPLLPPRTVPIRDSRLLAIYDVLLARHMPSALLVDDDHQLVHSFGGAEQLLRVRPGRLTTNVLDMLDPDLKGALSGALQRVRRDGKPLRYTGLQTMIGGQPRQVQLTVEPLAINANDAADYLIVFEDVGPPAVPPEEPTDSVDATRVSRDYIAQLEGELRFTKENLQATIEELETANEELQATNEELVAANEELQSTNEELHSVNEELQSVNTEHQRKIDQLTELTDDMDNLLHSIDIGVLFLDEDLRIREFTAAMAQAFRLIRQDRGRSFADFAYHLVHPTLLADIEAVRRTGQAQSHEVSNASGELRLLRILPYRTKGRIAGIVLTLIDISTLRRAEANVRRLSAIVEHANDAIFREDFAGNVTDWNRAAANLFGWRAEEIVGRSASALVDGGHHQEMLDIHTRVRSGESFEDFETTRLHRTGRPIDVALTISPSRDERQAVVGASTIARDITRRKRAEEVARQALEQRERFLATLSHELRNPMAAMLSAADAIAGSDVTPKGKKAVDVIRRQVRHTAHLLEDLLDISRMLHGRLPISPTPMDAREIVDDVLDEIRPRASDAGVALDVHVPETPLPVRGDRTRLKQLLANLLGNAVKYSPPGDTVEASLFAENGDVLIRVRDHGVGIEPDDAQLIFEPFYQGRGGAVGGGMGLGLALVRAIARAHGGEVSVESDGRGKGSTFAVRMPRLHADVPLPVHAPEPRRPAASSLDRRVILLVEDQDDNRELLGLALDEAGYRVTAAATVAEALRALETLRPSIALVDITLPDGTGDVVARRIRALPDGHAIRMIAMTGHGRQSDREAILAAGFDVHLVKPVSLETLVSALES